MDDAHASIFANAASLDEYCCSIRVRLDQRAHEQSALLASRLDSLQSLLRTAHAVGDRELEAELTSHLEGVRARQSELGQLLAGDDSLARPRRVEADVPTAASVAAPAPPEAEPVDSAPVADAVTIVPEPQPVESYSPVQATGAGVEPAPEVVPPAVEAGWPAPKAEQTPIAEPVAAEADPEASEPEPLPAAAVSPPTPEPVSLWASPSPAPAPPWAPLPPAAMAPPPAWQTGAAATAAPAAAPNPDMPWLPASPVVAEPAPAQSIEDSAWAELAAQSAGSRAAPSSAVNDPGPPAWAKPEPDRGATAPAASPPNWDTNFAVPASATDPEMGGLCLEVSVGEREWSWRMVGDSAVIGRATPGTSIMPDLDLWPDQTVSRRHLEVVAREGRYFVTDQASANGSLLNDAPLPPNVETEIHAGDQLRLGAASLLKVTGI